MGSNRKDEYSDFRKYLRDVRSRVKTKNLEMDISLEYLKELWDDQEGICPYTKWEIKLKTHSSNTKLAPADASLDRIDNNFGYIKGNLKFVSMMYNFAKNRFSDEDVIEFCKSVVRNTDNN